MHEETITASFYILSLCNPVDDDLHPPLQNILVCIQQKQIEIIRAFSTHTFSFKRRVLKNPPNEAKKAIRLIIAKDLIDEFELLHIQ